MSDKGRGKYHSSHHLSFLNISYITPEKSVYLSQFIGGPSGQGKGSGGQGGGSDLSCSTGLGGCALGGKGGDSNNGFGCTISLAECGFGRQGGSSGGKGVGSGGQGVGSGGNKKKCEHEYKRTHKHIRCHRKARIVTGCRFDPKQEIFSIQVQVNCDMFV